MAKSSYKIPVSLDRSMPDHEIKLASNIPSSPLKQLGFLGGGILVAFWAVMATGLKNASAAPKVFFFIWTILLVVYLGGLLKTRELRATQIPVLLNYMPPIERKVMTRRSSNPTPLSTIVGISGVEQDGRIHFGDGGEGQIYMVVGSASNLLFDEDKVAMLDRNDGFWRKVDSSCEWMTITRKEPQRIYHQVASLAERDAALEVRDPDLIELENEQHDILKDYVGGQFASIHQYFLIKGHSEDALHRGHTILRSEIENSTLMIKEAAMLNGDEALSVLQVFYQGVISGGPRSKVTKGED